MTPDEAIRQLRNDTDATACAPEALQFVIDAVQELAALKAMRALSSRPPTLKGAHEVIAMMDVEVTGSMADVVGLRKQLKAVLAAYKQIEAAFDDNDFIGAENGIRVLAEALGVDRDA